MHKTERMKILKKIKFMVALTLAVFCLAGSMSLSAYAADKKITIPKKDRDVLVVGAENEPGGLDISNQTTQGAMTAASPAFETLIKKNDETGEYEPWLATEWKWIDDKTLAITIRDDVYFHNGEKLTAEDVKYTIARLAKGSATASLYSSFDGANSKVIDDTHIEIPFKDVCAPAIALLSSPGANVVNKKYVEEVGDAAFNRKPVGTGPFKFVSWVSGDSITYERFDKYWGKTSEYKTLLLRILPDLSARMMAVENGDVDIALILLPTFTEKLKAGEVPGVDLYAVPGVYMYWLAMNENFEPFKNLKVRQAIAHAVDTSQVAAASWGANCTVLSSIAPKSCWGYKEAEPFEYNIAKAKELLKEAGYPNGFEVTYIVSEVTNPSNAAEAVQALLSQIGIRCKLEKYTTSTWQAKVLDGSATLSFGGLTVSTGDISQAVMHLASTSPQITYRWNDPKMDGMIELGMKELDPEKRYQIYSELQDHVLENVYDIPILNTLYTFACRDYVKGFVPHSRMLLDWASITFTE